MDNVTHAEDLFADRTRQVVRMRDRGEFPDEEKLSSAVVAAIIEPVQKPRVRNKMGTTSSSRALIPVSDHRVSHEVPATLQDRRLAYANLQYAQFQLDQAIAQLVKESDGGSKTIPKLRQVAQTLGVCIPKLS